MQDAGELSLQPALPRFGSAIVEHMVPAFADQPLAAAFVEPARDRRPIGAVLLLASIPADVDERGLKIIGAFALLATAAMR
jgi:hypothetical protein